MSLLQLVRQVESLRKDRLQSLLHRERQSREHAEARVLDLRLAVKLLVPALLPRIRAKETKRIETGIADKVAALERLGTVRPRQRFRLLHRCRLGVAAHDAEHRCLSFASRLDVLQRTALEILHHELLTLLRELRHLARQGGNVQLELLEVPELLNHSGAALLGGKHALRNVRLEALHVGELLEDGRGFAEHRRLEDRLLDDVNQDSDHSKTASLEFLQLTRSPLLGARSVHVRKAHIAGQVARALLEPAVHDGRRTAESLLQLVRQVESLRKDRLQSLLHRERQSREHAEARVLDLRLAVKLLVPALLPRIRAKETKRIETGIADKVAA